MKFMYISIFNIQLLKILWFIKLLQYVSKLSNEQYKKIAVSLKTEILNRVSNLDQDKISKIFIESISSYDIERITDLVDRKYIDIEKSTVGYKLKDIGLIKIPICLYNMLKTLNSSSNVGFKNLSLNVRGLTVLHILIIEDNFALFSSFIKSDNYNPNDLNKKDALGNTPLSMALIRNKINYVKLLLTCEGINLCVCDIPRRLYKKYIELTTSKLSDIGIDPNGCEVNPMNSKPVPYNHFWNQNYAPFTPTGLPVTNIGTKFISSAGLRCDPHTAWTYQSPPMPDFSLDEHLDTSTSYEYLIEAFERAIVSKEFIYDYVLADIMITSQYVNSELFILMANNASSSIKNDRDMLIEVFSADLQEFDIETSYTKYI